MPVPMVRWLVVAVLPLLALACSSLPIGSGGVDGPVIYSGGSLGGGEDAEVGGVVTFDGECLYLTFVDDPSLRYPVVWPRGTRWQEDPQGVVLPNGDVALVGDIVTGGGGYHQPDYVESLAGSAGAELADNCADGQYREVAIFNPESDVDLQLLAFEDPQLAGLCESMIADFAEGEPAPSSSEQEAAAQFVAEAQILEGLDVEDGKISLRGEQVGTYQVVPRPGDTFAVESAEWCYPDE